MPLEFLLAPVAHELGQGNAHRAHLLAAAAEGGGVGQVGRALDAGQRERTGFELRALQRETGATFVMVTHDPKVADWMQRRVEIRDGIIHDDRRLGVQP